MKTRSQRIRERLGPDGRLYVIMGVCTVLFVSHYVVQAVSPNHWWVDSLFRWCLYPIEMWGAGGAWMLVKQRRFLRRLPDRFPGAPGQAP